ncbi:hypothetical protein N865_15615 [Intrasporangium oryzae NRRL B-24470]|uniref:Protein-glutamine gamma-glutamyltransferase-like C-terminal domain-containing protein n=1 Tax=Intrasporangium oryzae NRRL B-24470 TaxID=1386089 RepID=W9G6N9_9MICO|nr:DUF4129 domain-containing protein [Intrasporangium oryzae]EWT00478.1 hypothetical protein N865_15615 [Intrasporangium oryzae NRRL B-24470]
MSRRGVIATVGGALVVLAALLVASGGRPVELVTRPATTDTATRVPITPPSSAVTMPTQFATTTGQQGWDASPIFGALFAILGTLFVLALIAVVATVIRSLYRKPTLTLHTEATFEVPPVPDELLRSAATRRALLETGAPRNAIVAAWLDLETSAAASGLARLPAETSTEYTARVIGTWDVDRERLADLAALYREARFSSHDLTEDHRHRAIVDLETLHDDLARVAAHGAPTADDVTTTPGEPT